MIHEHDWQPAADYAEIALCECGDYQTLKQLDLEEAIARVRKLHQVKILTFAWGSIQTDKCVKCSEVLPCSTLLALEGDQ